MIETEVLKSETSLYVELFQLDLGSVGYKGAYIDNSFTERTSYINFDVGNISEVVDYYPDNDITINEQPGMEGSISVYQGTLRINRYLWFNWLHVRNAFSAILGISTTIEFEIMIPNLTPTRLGIAVAQVTTWMFEMQYAVWDDGKMYFFLGNGVSWIPMEITPAVKHHICAQYTSGVGYSLAIDGVFSPIILSEQQTGQENTIVYPAPPEDPTNYYGVYFGRGIGVYDQYNTFYYIDNIKVYKTTKHIQNFDPYEQETKFYFTNSSKSSVTFGGKSYTPLPLQITGLSQNSTSAPARPTLTLGNLDTNHQLRKLAYQYNDLVGCKVKYIRTFKEYLNTNEDISAANIIFTIGRKLSHDHKQISFELRDPRDRENFFLPPRTMLKKDFPGLGLNRNIR